MPEPIIKVEDFPKGKSEDRSKLDPIKELSDFSDLVMDFINSSSAISTNGF